MQRNKDIILFGIQGSGKWTQAAKLLTEFPSYKYLEPGNIFRAINSNTNMVSQYVKETMKKGAMVKNSLVFDLFNLCSHLLESNEAFLIDGFPRNMQQMDYFLAHQAMNDRDYICIYFDLPRNLAVERIQIRAHLQGREDDLNMETVNKRLDLFEQETLPVIEHLRSRGKLVTINANQPIETVFAQVKQELGLTN